MPHLNLSFSALIYEDISEKNPSIRLPDLSKNIQGIGVQYDKSDRILLNPSETKDIVVTTRNVLWDITTELQFLRFISGDDRMRIKWTGNGTNPSFRILRSIAGDATTVVSISRISPYVARIQVQSGTAWNTSSVQVGDFIRFEANNDSLTSPFSDTNLGKQYQVQAKGANYIDFIDNGESSLDTNVTLGADYSDVLRVLSAGPVKVNDTVEISGSNINPSNTGRFTIIDVNSDYVEIINPFGVEETVTYSASSLFTVYEYLIGFVLARGIGGPFKVRFGSQSEWVLVDRIGDTALMMASVSTYKIEAKNDGLYPIEISIQHAKVVN